MDQDPDEEFMRLVQDIHVEDPTVPEYATMSDFALSVEKSRVRKILVDLMELYNPNPTGGAAELHSQLAAINFEMKRRWRRMK